MPKTLRKKQKCALNDDTKYRVRCGNTSANLTDLLLIAQNWQTQPSDFKAIYDNSVDTFYFSHVAISWCRGHNEDDSETIKKALTYEKCKTNNCPSGSLRYYYNEAHHICRVMGMGVCPVEKQNFAPFRRIGSHALGCEGCVLARYYRLLSDTKTAQQVCDNIEQVWRDYETTM